MQASKITMAYGPYQVMDHPRLQLEVVPPPHSLHWSSLCTVDVYHGRLLNMHHTVHMRHQEMHMSWCKLSLIQLRLKKMMPYKEKQCTLQPTNHQGKPQQTIYTLSRRLHRRWCMHHPFTHWEKPHRKTESIMQRFHQKNSLTYQNNPPIVQ